MNPTTQLTQLGSDHFYSLFESPQPKLPRLALISKGLFVNNGKVESGNYAIIDGEQVADIGSTVDILPLARRPKALDCSGETPTADYDPDSIEFQRIRELSRERDSCCMWGVSFLVVAESQFCEYFCGTRSGRTIVPALSHFLPLTKADIEVRNLAVMPRKPMACSLSSKIVEQGKQWWHAPVVSECSGGIELPSNAGDEIDRFLTRI